MGWEDFEETKKRLTATEIRFEEIRRSLGLVLGPLAFVVIAFPAPNPSRGRTCGDEDPGNLFLGCDLVDY